MRYQKSACELKKKALEIDNNQVLWIKNQDLGMFSIAIAQVRLG